MILRLAAKSLRNRRLTAALTVASIALSVTLLLAVERVRQQAREGFASTLSGTDLIVGARAGPAQLLLASVFGIGSPTQNLGWDTYRRLAARPGVAWTIPLALGDSHRGFRVLGTTRDYLDHFRFGRSRGLKLAQGRWFSQAQDAVLGATVARSLGYTLGQQIVVAHGGGEVAFALHAEHPFRVVGILARTGTPVDRTVHVSLAAIDAIHAAHGEAAHDPLAAALEAAASPRSAAATAAPAAGGAISAVLVGLDARGAALSVQRELNQYAAEPLSAILPGATLLEVWEIVGTAENTLRVVAMLVAVVGFAGMLVALLTGLGERRREMAVLRALGARPAQVFGLIVGEAAFLTLAGGLLGAAALCLGLRLAQPWLEARFGLFVGAGLPSPAELALLALFEVAGVLIGLIPAYRSYRYALADGMTLRV